MNGIKKEKGTCGQYVHPEIIVMDFQLEGILCGSNEILDENEGEW